MMLLYSRHKSLTLFYFVILLTVCWIYFCHNVGPTTRDSNVNHVDLGKLEPRPQQFPEILTTQFDLTNYDQKDAVLVAHVGHHYITKPSTLPYTFPDSSPNGIVYAIWPILEKVVDASKRGFFVEAGAYDGVAASNTLWLERVHEWNGLLVECHPEVVPILRQRQRKAYITDACLSSDSHPATAELTSVDGWHPSSSLGSEKKLFPDFAKTFTKFKVQTIPLYTLLAAINVTSVDFISLDIQGLEYEVLTQFPFDLILVKVWLFEDDLMSPENKINLKNLMKQNGYSEPRHPTSSDQLYIHKSIEHKLN